MAQRSLLQQYPLAASLLGSVLSIGVLSGAVIIEPTPLDATNPPGVNQASQTPQSPARAPEPRPGVSQLLRDDAVMDKRVQELIRIAADELATPPAKDKNKSSKKTTGSALLTLGLLYFHGLHVQEDKARAQELFIRSRLLKNNLAAIALAWCYLDGCGQAPNFAAFEKLLPAVNRRSRRRANYLRYESALKQSSQEQGLPDDARKFLRQAAAANDRFALNETGLIQVQAGRLPDAIQSFLRAARKGSDVAQRNADLAQRTLLDRSSGTGKALAGRGQISANQHNSAAASLYQQARQLHRTATALPAYATAIDLYQQAAALGHKPAKQVLSLILSRPTPSGTIDPVWMRQTSLIQLPNSGASAIGVSEQLFEREPSPIIDLLPDSFANPTTG